MTRETADESVGNWCGGTSWVSCVGNGPEILYATTSLVVLGLFRDSIDRGRRTSTVAPYDPNQHKGLKVPLLPSVSLSPSPVTIVNW